MSYKLLVEKIIYNYADILERAIGELGLKHQVQKSIEELSEYLCLFFEELDTLEKEEAFLEEIVDSLIMLHQLRDFSPLYNGKAYEEKATKNASIVLIRELSWFLNKGKDVDMELVQDCINELTGDLEIYTRQEVELMFAKKMNKLVNYLAVY